MQKLVLFLSLCLSVVSCSTSVSEKLDQTTESKRINALLDSFNVAAANANFDLYFSYFSPDAVFMGTDATEYWDMNAYKAFAKPYFDAGTTWKFKNVKRNLYFDESAPVAWFDEVLDTQMKLCRGSGVLTKTGDSWKLKQYVLSITMPNNILDSAVGLKAPFEEVQLIQLQSQ
jgi:hypothetical protein